MDGLQFFDPKQDVSIAWKALPHWAQAGTVCFITWRTADSLPNSLIRQLAQERDKTLRTFGLDPASEWKKAMAKLPSRDRSRLHTALFRAWDRHLDRGLGACELARPDLSQIVEECLLHFDDERYLLTDSVVMPNHIHLLVAFREEDMLLTQCTSWKRYTGVRIQAALGQHGEFWQVEQFDHLVRGRDQFEHLRRYIATNPQKAGLEHGSYRMYSKQLDP